MGFGVKIWVLRKLRRKCWDLLEIMVGVNMEKVIRGIETGINVIMNERERKRIVGYGV